MFLNDIFQIPPATSILPTFLPTTVRLLRRIKYRGSCGQNSLREFAMNLFLCYFARLGEES